MTEIYGRKILDNLREGTAYHLYLPGPHKGIFNLEALKTSREIILCEAIIDALTFWNAGFHNVTASYGVNGFTPDHLEAFKKYGVEKVFIAYDRDQAGDKAAEKLSRDLISEGFECFRILFPRNMDANEYALKTKPAQKALDLVFRNAEWLGKGKREFIQIPEIQEAGGRPEEPKEATKGKNIEELEGLEISSQASEQTEDLFPLDAKNKPDEPQKPEPARNAPVSKGFEPITEISEEEIMIIMENRRWRIRGLGKNTNHDQLKVNIRISKRKIPILILSIFVPLVPVLNFKNRLQRNSRLKRKS